MQTLSKNLKIRLYSTFILTGLAVILFTVSIFTAFDSSTGYFDTSLLYSVAKGLGIVTVVLGVSSVFTLPKGELGGDSPLAFPVIFPSAFCALVMFAGGICLLGSVLGFLPASWAFTKLAKTSSGLLLIAAVFTFLAVVYFILNCFPQDGKPKQTHALIGFSLPIAAVLWIAAGYFDLTVSMNAPIKTFTHLALIFFTLWSGYELRTMLGKPMPRLYFGAGLTVVFFSGAASLPWLIGYIAGAVSGPAYPTYLLYNLISLAIFAYSVVRLTVFVQARDLYERIADQTPPEEAPEHEEEGTAEPLPEDQDRKDQE